MDLSSLGGIIIGLGVIIGVLVFENGSLGMFISPVPALIVFCGTFAATILNFSISSVRIAFSSAKEIFINEKDYTYKIIAQIIDISHISRQNGLLGLRNVVDKIEDNFLRRGVQLAMDISNPQLLNEVLTTEINLEEEQELINSRIFEAMGGYAPTFGIIGAVIGLIQVMSNLQDFTRLGSGIATAFIATLYGVGAANLIFLPIAGKLKMRLREKMLLKELIVQGLISVQMNEHPSIIEEKLISYLNFTNKRNNFYKKTKKAI
ncbi:MAG: flagellar motor protein [Candidatus Gastranaerophilales bacterium]|nr:flagellar motor protein [Candidatus Gastranaerophilales bacterium]